MTLLSRFRFYRQRIPNYREPSPSKRFLTLCAILTLGVISGAVVLITLDHFLDWKNIGVSAVVGAVISCIVFLRVTHGRWLMNRLTLPTLSMFTIFLGLVAIALSIQMDPTSREIIMRYTAGEQTFLHHVEMARASKDLTPDQYSSFMAANHECTFADSPENVSKAELESFTRYALPYYRELLEQNPSFEEWAEARRKDYRITPGTIWGFWLGAATAVDYIMMIAVILLAAIAGWVIDRTRKIAEHETDFIYDEDE